MPQLLDPNFKRAVVLLVHHDEEGTFGLVVNQPSELSVRQVCDDLSIPWCGDEAATLRIGGPVQPETGWVVFGDGGDDFEDVHRVVEGLSVAGSLQTLREIAAAPPDRLAFLLGYAGWGPHQLEEELAQGAWLLAPVCADVVFGVDPGEMWERVLRDLGVDPSTLVATPGVH